MNIKCEFTEEQALLQDDSNVTGTKKEGLQSGRHVGDS
jgi:hypothetical protein